MRRFLRFLLVTVPLLLGVHASPSWADDAGVWANQNVVLDLRPPDAKRGFELSFDLHERAWGPTWLGIVRPGLGYELGHGISVWTGYAFVPSFVSGSDAPPKLEHRVWEQLLVTEKVGQVALQGRARLEHRFLDGVAGIGVRLRLYARAGFFFGAGAHWGWALSDEVLVKLNTTSAWAAGFDQNRAFTGPFYQASDGVRVEFGYLNLLVDKPDLGLVDSHVAMVNLLVPVKVFGTHAHAPAASEATPVEDTPPGR